MGSSSKPKLSVIMPAYNRAGIIADAIRSVFAQTFQDFELIIVDDGSTDNTREVVSRFPDARINYIFQENRGVAVARNTALEAARGEYVLFLDSDDILVQRALEKSVAVLDANPEVSFSYGQAYLMDERKRIYGLRRQGYHGSYVVPGKEEIKKAIVNGNHIPLSTIVARRDTLREVNFFDNTFRRGSEDFDLWVKLARKYSVAYIAEPLAGYRVHNGNITTGRRLKEVEHSNGLIFKRLFKDPELGPLFEKKRPQVYRNLFMRLSEYAYSSRDMKTSRKYLLRALKVDRGWFLKRLYLPLLRRIVKTWLPRAILNLGHNTKRFLSIKFLTYSLKFKLRPTIQTMSLI